MALFIEGLWAYPPTLVEAMGEEPSKTARYLEINRVSWDLIAQEKKGRTALPLYGPLAPDENELQLLGNLRGMRVIEIGCGSGHSLAYLHRHGAAELWGLDLSAEQIKAAEVTCREAGCEPRLLCSPMERDPGIPAHYFDLAVSIYALGWSVDLKAAVSLIARYLKPGGCLVFSWEHPVYRCLRPKLSAVVLDESYSSEGPIEKMNWKGEPIVMHARKISTFINTLIECGFVIDRVIEGDLRPAAAGQSDFPHRYYSKDKARMMPTTLIIKAHTPG